MKDFWFKELTAAQTAAKQREKLVLVDVWEDT